MFSKSNGKFLILYRSGVRTNCSTYAIYAWNPALCLKIIRISVNSWHERGMSEKVNPVEKKDIMLVNSSLKGEWNVFHDNWFYANLVLDIVNFAILYL